MKVEHFFMAIEIANTGSFSQAARNLYISQPNLSHAMKQLEQELGFPLFTRTPSGIIPTPEGNAIIDQFRTMKWEYDQISEAVKSRVYTSRLSLRIATLQGSWTTALFSDFELHSDIEMIIDSNIECTAVEGGFCLPCPNSYEAESLKETITLYSEDEKSEISSWRWCCCWPRRPWRRCPCF